MRFTVIAAVALTLGGSVAQAENLRRRGLPDLGNSLGSSKITKIVSFGDSLTDTGVVANLTKNNGPASQIPSNAYYNGRFTNGPVWLEYVAQSKSLDLENYAAGGATTSDVLVQGWVGGKFGEPLTKNGTTQPVPGVDTQISSYIKPPPSIFSATGFDFATQVLEWAKELLNRPRTLYTIFIGANDYFDNLILGLGKNGSYFAAAQYKEWENLANFGALKIMPMVLAGGSDDFGTFLTAYGDEIDRQIVKFKGHYPWVKIFKYVVPGAAFVNTTYSPVLIDSPPCCTGNCFSGLPPIGTAVVCSNPNAYLGWDGIHPTTVVHKYIAGDVMSFIDKNFGW